MNTITVQVSHEDIDKWEEVVQKFVKENPGQPIPPTMLRWLFNMSTEWDVEVAKERLEFRPEVLYREKV